MCFLFAFLLAVMISNYFGKNQCGNKKNIYNISLVFEHYLYFYLQVFKYDVMNTRHGDVLLE